MSGKEQPQPERRIRCFTRAAKNARFLQQHEPETFAKDKDAEGFGTGIPLHILHRLHHLNPDSPELRSYPAVSEFLKRRAMPKPGRLK
jgi:hypothetical protein